MLLAPDQGELFHRLYQPLLAFAAARLGGVAGVFDLASFKAAKMQAKARVRDAFYDNSELIGRYADENPDRLPQAELALIRDWRHFLRGKFFVVADLKRYAVFLSEAQPAQAYGVLGLTTEIVEMLSMPLPVILEAVLLPWKGQVVCDGLFSAYSVTFGTNIRRGLMETYRDLKASSGIVTSLEASAHPVPSHPSRPRQRHVAIRRFLRQCPETVEEFKGRYGEPRVVLDRDLAQEYSFWRLDGTPVFEADLLMVYGNILRKRVLYVYSVEGKITYVGVVDPPPSRPSAGFSDGERA